MLIMFEMCKDDRQSIMIVNMNVVDFFSVKDIMMSS